MIKFIVKFFLDNKLVAWIMLAMFVLWGLVTAPFESGSDVIPRDPVAVDAIPDIGENQQIVFTQWMGRSPQDVEDQITSKLTSALLGIPGVKSVRSNSMFGFSSIYLIFEEDIEFYWSRSRILEKLNSLPDNTVPPGAQPTLGPDATALGQIYWYTLEGQDPDGNTTGGWDQQELRSIQDFYVKYGLQSASGVSEVASIGGFVKEYQVDVDPEKMRSYGLSLNQIMKSVKESNLDIGAQTIEINLVEYFVRGLGYVKSVEDIENSVVKVVDNVPVRIMDVATVHLGPATRRGILDKSGAPAVGGVVVARYGANPLEVINNVKSQIDELAGGLPSKTLADGTVSKVTIVPFYDRTELIKETIGTLEEALTLEILITIIVVILMLLHLKSSLLISASLPVAVLMCFIAMRYFGVDANIVALSGIAIAVGTMVDMGIVLTESMVSQMKIAPPEQALKTTIYLATVDVASAVVTAVATTIVSFLPVFTMEAAEGKMFRPLAFTKTFALLSSILLAITVIPPLAEQLFKLKSKGKISAYLSNGSLVLLSLTLLFTHYAFFGVFGLVVGITGGISTYAKGVKSETWVKRFDYGKNISYALVVCWLLARIWMPLGVVKSTFSNFLFIAIIIGCLIGFFYVIIHFYERILRFFLRWKIIFLSCTVFIIIGGCSVFMDTKREFMPALNEGSFLLMPTSMPHSGNEINEANLRMLDMAVSAIPEVELVVGKAGRIESSLDPAPMSMYENIISYKSEYKTNEDGRRVRFKVDENNEYLYDDLGELIPDENGKYFRQWRDHIKSPDDIWTEIVAATKIPGLTSAPKLQPIETRLVMLQTGMRAPMGIKVKGTSLKEIEEFGLQLEMFLKDVPGVKNSAVFADRIVGKPYMMLNIDRHEISRHGLTIVQVQNQLQTAIGGMIMTTTVEGRERYGIRLRYPLELRNEPEKIKSIYITDAFGAQIPLGDLVNITYEQGPMSIKSEDGFLVGFVLFDKVDDDDVKENEDPKDFKEDGTAYSEIEIVENAQKLFDQKTKGGQLVAPEGVTYRFAGNYEQHERFIKRLIIVIPISLILIFLILYFHFKSAITSLFVFSGVLLAFSGGFIMIGLYGQDWFMNFEMFGTNMRELFQMHPIKLSVAVWVGFLALFGIATDDGVLVATFLKDSFKKNHPTSVNGIHDAVVEGGLRRVKPAMMTTATTILALLPVLTSTGKGADIMLPMAIPSFGGMVLNTITMFTVPVLYCTWKEAQLKFGKNRSIKESGTEGSPNTEIS
jgi:Cu(I)/Ag(I) efflux system membrane protein CusA/SilA